MERAALFFSEEADNIVQCDLCPRRCAIPNGRFGACGVRGNKSGKGIIPFYGHVTALASDPIEKKPLYHFRPGSTILSVGFSGCNLRCPFCQNWHISQDANAPGTSMQPGDIVSAALRENSQAIAYTYSEPLVHTEFLLDCMALAHHHGIANVLVSNGCVNNASGVGADIAQEILSLTDAANIDLKCFSADTYAKTLGAFAPGDSAFETVLAFIGLAVAQGVHVELTTLLVPGLNDSDEELDQCADFIASLDSGGSPGGIPWHLSAYHPDYRWNAPPTDPAFLKRTKDRAAGKLKYVYAGNTGEENNTVCPGCGAVLVRRRGYRVDCSGLAAPSNGDGLAGENFFRCARCGGETAVRY